MLTRAASLLLLIGCLFVGVSCTTEQSSPLVSTGGLDETATPVLPTAYWPFVPSSNFGPAMITGCRWSDELGNEAGEWGNPTGGRPYPNPTSGDVVCSYGIVTDCEVVWWLVKAYGPGERPPEGSGQNGGATFVRPSEVLLGPLSEFQATGLHHIGWDGKDRSGAILPQGYYRMYAQLPEVGLTAWWDILIGPRLIPVGIE